MPPFKLISVHYGAKTSNEAADRIAAYLAGLERLSGAIAQISRFALAERVGAIYAHKSGWLSAIARAGNSSQSLLDFGLPSEKQARADRMAYAAVQMSLRDPARDPRVYQELVRQKWPNSPAIELVLLLLALLDAEDALAQGADCHRLASVAVDLRRTLNVVTGALEECRDSLGRRASLTVV